MVNVFFPRPLKVTKSSMNNVFRATLKHEYFSHILVARSSQNSKLYFRGLFFQRVYLLKFPPFYALFFFLFDFYRRSCAYSNSKAYLRYIPRFNIFNIRMETRGNFW